MKQTYLTIIQRIREVEKRQAEYTNFLAESRRLEELYLQQARELETQQPLGGDQVCASLAESVRAQLAAIRRGAGL